MKDPEIYRPHHVQLRQHVEAVHVPPQIRIRWRVLLVVALVMLVLVGVSR